MSSWEEPLSKRANARRERRIQQQLLLQQGHHHSSKTDDFSSSSSSSSSNLIVVDGGALEGGGQILRLSFGLSALTGRPIKVHSIRKHRSVPGFRAQHLAGCKLIQRLCAADFRGDTVGEVTCAFFPKDLVVRSRSEEMVVHIGTAGAITLIIQAALPCLLFLRPHSAIANLRLTGGTLVNFSPSMQYFERVFKPMLACMLPQSLERIIDISIKRNGFYPAGGGDVRLRVTSLGAGASLLPVRLLRRGRVTRIEAVALAFGRCRRSCVTHMSTLTDITKRVWRRRSKDIPLRFVEESVSLISGRRGRRRSDKPSPSTALSPTGLSLLLIARSNTGSIVGASGLRDVPRKPPKNPTSWSEELATSVVNDMMHALDSGTCVDEHMADQLIIFMALAKGLSALLIAPPPFKSKHMEAAVHIATKFTGASFRILDLPISSATAGEALGISDVRFGDDDKDDLSALRRELTSLKGGGRVLLCRGIAYRRRKSSDDEI